MRLAYWSGKVCDRPFSTGLLLPAMTIGIVVVAFFAARTGGVPTVTMISTGRLNQSLRQSRKPAHIRIGETRFNDVVFAINVSQPLQSLVKDFEALGRLLGSRQSRGVEPADTPYSALGRCVGNTRQQAGDDDDNRGKDGLVRHANQPFGSSEVQDERCSVVLTDIPRMPGS